MRRFLTDRTVNGLLLGTIVVLGASGILSLFANAEGQRLVFAAHRVGGAALLVLLVPKAGIVWRALRRKAASRSAGGRAGLALSLVLLIATLASVVAALGWSLTRGPWGGEWGLPLIVVHWYLGLTILPLATAHVAIRWSRASRVPRAADFRGRRRVVALAASAALALGGWRALGAGAAGTEGRAGRRRFTGSREADYGTPNGFFVTAFIADDPAPLDLAGWRLQVVGLVARPLTLDRAALSADATVTAAIDCTGGIYATRAWSGLAVGPLLDAAGAAPEATTAWFVSTTGHRWPLPLDEARRALLATHVNGEPLAHAHGAPLRLVAPERRGFQWIKWLERIELR